MKTRIPFITCVAISIMTVLTAASIDSANDHNTHNKGGTSTSTGAPGETHTCSQSGCHGAGNGSSTSGGLADNAGPGSITISSVPAISGSTYVAGTTYHMTVTVTETGKQVFGFNFEALDNSGNTNLHTNNTAGSYTITDATHTHIMQSFGTGRMTVCHMLNGGLSSNTASFIFDWTAPASGTVNFYCSATACNNDGQPDAQDNVYTKYMLALTPTSATGISENTCSSLGLQAYPNPASNHLTVSLILTQDAVTNIQLYSLDGRLIATLENSTLQAGTFTHTYSTEGLAKGPYLLRTSAESYTLCKTIVIQ
jgi:hypothetical protein